MFGPQVEPALGGVPLLAVRPLKVTASRRACRNRPRSRSLVDEGQKGDHHDKALVSGHSRGRAGRVRFRRTRIACGVFDKRGRPSRRMSDIDPHHNSGRPSRDREPIRISADDARGGEIILRTRRRRIVFLAGLAGFVILAVIVRLAGLA